MPDPDFRPKLPSELRILLVATFFVAIGFGLVVPVLPRFAESFGVTPMLVGVVVSAFALMRLIGAPVAGTLVNRLGEQRIYVLGLLIVAASSLGSAVAESYGFLLVARGLGGLGSVMFTVASAGLVVTYAPAAIRGRVSALWGGTFLIGNIAGPALGGFLGQMGMRIPFVVYAGALGIAALIAAVFLHRPGRSPGSGTPREQRQGPPLRMRDVWPDSAYRAALVSGFAAGWANFGVRSAVVPLFLGAAVSHEPWVAGTVIAVAAAGNMLALRLAGGGSDRRGRRPYLILGLIISGVSLLVMGLLHDLTLVMAVSFVGGVGAGLAAPAQQAAIADVVGRERPAGSVLSTVQMAQDVGTIAGPIVAGAIAGWVGYGWAFAATALVALAGAAAWTAAREPRAEATR